MTEVHSLSAELRERAGKGPARTTRRAGRVPGVIYGNHESPTLISMEPRELDREIHKTGFYTTLFDVKIDGKAHRVLPRDIQFDPVSDRAIHADFMRVTDKTRVRVHVPVSFTNEGLSPGIKRGGVLNIVRHEIDVVCEAGNIPHSIVVDVEGRDIGDSMHISMVKLPAGVRPAIADRDFTIATIAPPTVHKTEAEEAAEAAAAAATLAPEGAAAATAPAAGAAPGAPAAAAPAAAAPAKGAAAPKAPPAKSGGDKKVDRR
ncbi:MAG TPA: 50S ribosomal protein L25/general stress protein Ctc [Methylomirabilota bacterium]|nr:50S ribosomal protein L25/general stress protein Ctc [Methylomirabilota bacterium]